MEQQENLPTGNPDRVYRGSPAAYPRREPNVPFRAQLVFIAAMVAFGLGSMVSLAFGWPPGVAVSISVAVMLGAIPFAAGWTQVHPDPHATPENITERPMGPGPDLYPAVEAEAQLPPATHIEPPPPPA